MRSRSEWDASSTGLTTAPRPGPGYKSNFLIDLLPSTFRHNNLSEPLQGRRDILEAWQLLFQFHRDLEEEVAWLSSRLLSITTKDLGSSLSSTQQLLHRHQVETVEQTVLRLSAASNNRFFQALVQEIRSRRPLVQAVQEAGHSLVRRPRAVR